MKPRKAKDIKRTLLRKGFELNPKKEYHEYYYFVIDGKKSEVFTYFSHSKTEYNKHLLSMIKHQLKFESNDDFENFLDCPFSQDDYTQMLIKRAK